MLTPESVIDEQAPTPCRRGTSNSNARSNSKQRRRRREWIVATYPANVHVLEVEWVDGRSGRYYPSDPANEATWLEALSEDDAAVTVEQLPTTRCFRCGCLLTVDTVTCDRIVPGAEGGTYGGPVRDQKDRRTNVRPACGDCNSETGGHLGAARKAAAS